MPDKQKQLRVISLFEHMTSINTPLPRDQIDARLHHLGRLPQGELFSCFHEEDLEEATELYKILYTAKDFDEVINLAKQSRTFVNEGLFVYAVSVALLHRDDCKGIVVPAIQEIFPDRFVPTETINLAVKEAANHPDQDISVHVVETGNILDEEYKLAYFKEDVGTNAHHWHWHIVYPATWDPAFMGRMKDRKGELFYYMHQQMCARYDCERLSNGMRRMIPFSNFDEKLEGYSAHLTSLVSGLPYAFRPDGLCLHDLKDIDLKEMFRWRERILDAIDSGYYIDNEGHQVKLDIVDGINVLGALIESSFETKNKLYYGSLHNWGHVMMARLQDPDHRFNENPGVMSDTSTSLRDPIFYRYHRFIDNIFQKYIATLPHYTPEDLTCPGVHVVNVTVNAKVPNVVTTFMKEAELELSYGIDFGSDHSVKVLYRHLDHEPFTYNISVENSSGGAKDVTMRIFLGPKYDELGNRLQPEQQRTLNIELDKFKATLDPGKNVVTRDHRNSTVTVEQSVPVKKLREEGGVAGEYCSCGWPEHMLIPKGNHRGMDFELFVIVTDYAQDAVNGHGENAECVDAVSYCGAKDQKYPDKKPMGFPFDRVIEGLTFEEFLTVSMSCTDVRIKYTDIK
uniref:Hemocyanin E chain n=1 Tax=Aphonopelma sp. TaxID=29932 RepID=HCYE_APHSP|nr:RecName: Full=Hemocyanin E chain; Short=HcE [Aphonopelma sp.]